MLILSLLIIIILIGCWIALTPIKIQIDYKRLKEDDRLKVQVETFFGLIHYRMEISYLDIRRQFLFPIMELRSEFFGAKGKKEEDHVIEEFGLHALDLKELFEKVRFLIKITDKFEAMVEMMKSFKREDEHNQEVRMENVVIYRIMGMLFFGLKGNCQKLVWHTHFGFSDAAVTGLANGMVWTGKSAVLDIISIVSNMKTDPEISVSPDFNNQILEMVFESIFSIRIGNIMIAGFKIMLRELKRRLNDRWPITQLKL